MERNVVLRQVPASAGVAEGFSALKKAVRVPAERLRKYYSAVLERNLNMRQTWLLVNAQAAFALSVLPVESPLLFRLLCCGWFLHAVLWCRQEL